MHITDDAASGLTGTCRTYGRMVKFSHTLFALPFALSAAALAWARYGFSAAQLVWILAAMTGARSAAMGVNRLADAKLDGANPRTADREIPTGRIERSAVLGFVAAAAALFIGAAAMLGPTCFQLSIPVLLLLFAYSYTKRFTWLAHLYLGAAIGLAPIAAWIAVTGRFDPRILWLSAALCGYIAGFDILYACQDAVFDRAAGLRSIPARFGIARALQVAAGLHAAAFLAFVAFGYAAGLSWPYGCAVVLIGLWMAIEHRLVHPDDLSRLHIAFFHMNSAISLTLLAGVLADIWIG